MNISAVAVLIATPTAAVIITGRVAMLTGSISRRTDSDAITPTAKYLNSRAATIYGGSQEVQHNILARVVLGL